MRGLLKKTPEPGPAIAPAPGSGVFHQPKIEREAGSIHDPVARLRYLRQENVQQSAVGAGPIYLQRRWQVGGLAVLLVSLGVIGVTRKGVAAAAKPVERVSAAALAGKKSAVPDSLPEEKIWLVETRNGVEAYSNGLRIETRFTIPNIPRSYLTYDRRNQYEPSAESTNKVVGIVFHTTESQLVKFEATRNAELRRHAEGTLGYIQSVQAYHYVLDRFGRAFRVIREEDAAFHAGASIWAGDDVAYLNLNHSFLGVSFETASSKGDELPNVTAGQVTTARLLVDMLRQKYAIAAKNCVTHAQVSINPAALLVGYHTDWSGNFPFEELGLPDNYTLPLPSQTLFGLGYDPVFLQSTGSRLWKGLLAADDLIREQAKREKISAAALKARLQQEFRRVYPVRGKSADPGREAEPPKESGEAER